MSNRTKQNVLTALYFPFQMVIMVALSPLLLTGMAWHRSRDLAFDDIYITEHNPMLNQDGPSMQRKRRHCWLMRFINPFV